MPKLLLSHDSNQTIPPSLQGLTYPQNSAAEHPTAPMLIEHAKEGCPVNTGKNWTLKEITTAVKRGPQVSAIRPDAMKYAQQESAEKVKGGFAIIVLWDDIKNNPPPNTKVLPISMIEHKSRRYRGILDLSFFQRIKGYYVPSVNESSANTAPDYSLAQLGVVIPRLIHAISKSSDDGIPIFMSKLDVKDGF